MPEERGIKWPPNNAPVRRMTPNWCPIKDFDLADGEWALLFFGRHSNGGQFVEQGYRTNGQWWCIDSQCGGVDECGEPEGWFPIPEGFAVTAASEPPSAEQ
jgi:hypothetical protein